MEGGGNSGIPQPRKIYCRGMSRPFLSSQSEGQYNDEYDRIAHQKMTSKPDQKGYDRMVHWATTPSIHNLPSSVDDEYFDDFRIVTTVDLSMVRNASANALLALVAKENDFEIPVTAENCIKLLECTAQPYAWGKIGSNALVARMKAAQNASYSIVEDQPYAELWLGTHPNGMSNIILSSTSSKTTTTVMSSKLVDHDNTHPENLDAAEDPVSIRLIDYVQSNPRLHLGVEGVTTVSEDYDLTFLFKVLSIDKVLSIQAHPDKHLAAQLHIDMPHIYKDPNHKPEMAVALTDDFEALSGFRPLVEIAQHLQDYPEFADLVGHDICHLLNETVHGVGDCHHHHHHEPTLLLKHLFRKYMEAPHDLVQNKLSNLIARLSSTPFEGIQELDRLILKLADEFPGDAGIFAPLLFNHLKLKVGEAFYIGPNEPHAYIQGDILECMACSDNVVRAGLTPKVKDVETLVKMLTYDSAIPTITTGKRIDDCTLLYVPPVKDFAIEIFEVKPGSTHAMNNVRSPSVLLTLQGSGRIQQGSVQTLCMSFGKAAFMSANTTATVIVDDSATECLKIVRALSNVHLD